MASNKRNTPNIPNIPKNLSFFLNKYSNLHTNHPFILGLSGGPDSLSLFYSLLACKIPFVIAHIDHGWRGESENEAKQLAQLAMAYNIPFYLKNLDPHQIQGNLESGCRQERYRFFKQISEDIGAQGVILGHHADDQSETLLKKIFEGSCLTNLTGLKEMTEFEGIKILRPLLHLTKKQILHWLESLEFDPNQFRYFNDETNQDPSFMRARLRTKIIPWLSHEFKKEVGGAILSIGEEAQELAEYLDLQIKDLIESAVSGKLGMYIDLNKVNFDSKIILKHLIRRLCQKKNFFVSREIVNQMAESILENRSPVQFHMAKHSIWVDRKRVFMTPLWLKKGEGSNPLISGTVFIWGRWRIRTEITSKADIKSETEIKKINDTKIWKGYCECDLPVGEYNIGFMDSSKECVWTKSKIGAWWSSHHSPSFLRSRIPVIIKEDKVFYEFLTGRCPPPLNESESLLRIYFEYIDLE
jgi:tRNA(Ile)-lysidine synthase